MTIYSKLRPISAKFTKNWLFRDPAHIFFSLQSQSSSQDQSAKQSKKRRKKVPGSQLNDLKDLMGESYPSDMDATQDSTIQ